MRLAALVHRDLEPRMRRRERRGRGGERAAGELARAEQHREDVSSAASSSSATASSASSGVAKAPSGRPVRQRDPLARRDLDPVDRRSAHGARDLAAAHAGEGTRHGPRVRLEVGVGQVGDERARPLGERSGRQHARRACAACAAALSAASSALASFGSTSTPASARASIAATISAVDGSSPAGPRSTHRARAERLGERAVAVAARDEDDVAGSLGREALEPLGGLRVHVADLDAADHARRGPDAERAARDRPCARAP